METEIVVRPIEILLVEDNPGDVRLTREALNEGKIANILSVVKDGAEAISYLKKEDVYADAISPDLILLDLNLPKKNGQEVLVEIKSDKSLKCIPIIILTSSKLEDDVLETYENQANCYIIKPVDLKQFLEVVKSIEDFWFTVVKLPVERKC
jgi:two-component system, chemotaxis family, response regulator Rcp1